MRKKKNWILKNIIARDNVEVSLIRKETLKAVEILFQSFFVVKKSQVFAMNYATNW